MLSVSLLFSSAPLPVFAKELQEESKFTSVEEGYKYSVQENITSSWTGHANVDLVFTNTGSETIHNWYFTFSTPYTIDNIWNAAIAEMDGAGIYTIVNSTWNQDIASGQSVTVGITFSDADGISAMPEWYLLNTREAVVDPSEYSLSYQEQSSWNGGFTGALILQPSVQLKDWKVTFNASRVLSTVSSAVLSSQDDGVVSISNDGYNQNISAGASYYIGIAGVNSDAEFSISNVNMTASGLGYTLQEDSNMNGIADYLDVVMGTGTEIEPTVIPTPTDIPEVTVTPEPTVTVYPTAIPTGEVTPTVTPTVDPELDTDSDGIPDYIEEQLGTDKTNPDSDADGISDYTEVIIGYNPLSNDTDTNGISDGDEDFDKDGLSNVTEIRLGTSIVSHDSDSDGLSDGDEVNLYGTDPTKFDTDGDGIGDNDEISMGKDPSDASDGNLKVVQTIEQTIHNADEPAITSVELSMELTKLISNDVKISDLYNIDAYSTKVAGRIGSPIGFECSEDFNTATVTIHYDESKLGDTNEEDLGVLWYDEVDGVYIIQEQAVVNTESNTVTVELSHFSTYLLVDKKIWCNREPIDYTIPPTTEQYYDFYFALDVSQNMTLDARKIALSTLQSFISNMRSGDRICIIYFDTKYASSGEAISVDDTYAIDQMMQQVETNLMNASLGGQFGSYLIPFQLTATLINNYVADIGNEKALFILSNDTENFYAGNYINEMNYDKSSANFSANFVMMGNNGEGSWNYGWQYASATASNYYSYGKFVNLWDSFYDQYGKKSGWEIDNDGDGLPDFMEVQGMLQTNGEVMYTSVDCGSTDAIGMPEGYDDDDDHLSDGQELGQMYTIVVSDGNTTITPDTNNGYLLEAFRSIIGDDAQDGVWYIFDSTSDARLPDSDFDHYKDDIDNRPWTNDVLTFDLGGGTYDLFLKDVQGYIHVDGYPNQDVTKPLAYGGNQSWFNNVEIGPDGVELLTSEAGCGIIATNDVMLYCKNGAALYQWSNYKSSVITTYNTFPGIRINTADPNLPAIDLRAPAILPQQVQAVLSNNNYNSNCYYTCKTDLGPMLEVTDRDDMLYIIIQSISSNKPVILQELDPAGLLIGMLPNLTTPPGVKMYKRNNLADMDNFLTEVDHAAGHYVTITGIFIDEQANMRWLRVQSWGKEYYINFDEFYDYNTIEAGRLGNIIVVE